MRGPSEGLRENPALGRGGRGKGATPQPVAGPRGQDCHAAPPPGRQEASPGDQRAPPTPPPPSHTGPRAGWGAAPPPPPPPRTHLSWGATGAALRPPRAGGAPPPPPPRRNGDTVRATAAGPAPANSHRRAGATRTTEQEGGRAPHDPPVTTAHSEVTEGGFRSAGAPGGAVHGPPLTPPQPGAALQPRPHARAGKERAGDTERARKEYRRPPPGTRAGRPRRDTPPPPPPHQPASRGGPGPHPPRQGGWPPPAREGSRSVTRPPAPAAGSHGGREEQAGPRLRTGTPHRSYPEKPGEHEPEWYGGPGPAWTAQRH